MSDRPFEIIEAWVSHFEAPLLKAGKQFDSGMEAVSLALALDSAGFAIVPKVPTAGMVAAALPIVDNFGDEEIETAKKIGADAVLLLSPHGRAQQPIDKRAVSLAEGMVCDYRRMIAAADSR